MNNIERFNGSSGEEQPSSGAGVGILQPSADAVLHAAHDGQTATGSGKDLSNLDVLRSIAVLSVVVSHVIEVSWPAGPLNRYGAFGVGLFFIHTSLVLMWSLDRRPRTADFYVRRAFRIYPLSILAVLMVVAMHAPVAPFRGDLLFVYADPTWKQILTHLMLVQNLFGGNLLLYVMWSLPLEVQMYLALPPLFFFVERTRKVWPLLIFWAVLFLFSLREFSGQDLNLVFAACFFLPGVIAFVGFSKWRPRLPGWLFLPTILLIGTVGGRAHDWRGAAPAALAVGLVLPLFRQLQTGFLTRASWHVARYSYSIYLLHPFCLVLAFHLMPHLAYPLQILIFVVSLTIASLAGYRLIERPGIRLGAHVAARYAR